MLDIELLWGHEEFLLGFNFYDGGTEDQDGNEYEANVFSVGFGLFTIKFHYIHV